MIHTLELPWGFKHPDVQYWKNHKIHVYRGTILPPELRPYRSEDFSYARWQEDELNKMVMPPEKSSVSFTPREHQLEAAKKIIKAYQQGWRGFLEADKTGLGKGLASSTLLPTPQGLIPMKDIAVGQYVLSSDGLSTMVTAKYESKANRFYRITFSDGSTLDADEDHRWLTSDSTERNNPKIHEQFPLINRSDHEALQNHLLDAQHQHNAVDYNSLSSECENLAFIQKLLETVNPLNPQDQHHLYHPQEVLEALDRATAPHDKQHQDSVKTTREIVDSLYTTTGTPNHCIHNASMVEGTHQELPINPYILGAWLGSMDSVASMNILNDYGFEKLNQELNELYDSAPSKTIPVSYLTSHWEQRLELLRGIMDVAGSVDSHGVQFDLPDPLQADVKTLISSFGWQVMDCTKPNITRNQTATKESLRYYPTRQVFRIEDKASLLNEYLNNFATNVQYQFRYIVSVQEIEKTEPYYCISVDSPNHLYLAGREHIPTHNTLSTLSGITALAKQRGFGVKHKAKLLIVCPKSVIPQWRQTLHNYPVSTALMRPMVINYQQLNKLLETPETAKTAKKQRTKNRQTSQKGTPIIQWDFIIFDEAHYLKNYPSSTMSVAAVNIAQLEKPYQKDVSPFVVYSTATPGASPLNFASMAGIIAPLLTSVPTSKTVTPATWGPFLEKHNFAVTKGKTEYSWASVPSFSKNSKDPMERRKYEIAIKHAKEIQRKDAQRIGRGLLKPDAPFIMRSPKDIAGWPEQLTIPFPIALTNQQRPIYEEAWTRFRNWLRLTPAKRDPKGALVETLRYRQKSSLLKVDSMADMIADLVDSGNQVYISCEFMETIDRYKELLEARKLKVTEISGRNVSMRETERIKFQTGQVDVVLCTVVAGISLHAGETLPDGNKANSNPRVSIIHDIRQNNLDTEQALGRAHRDGQNANAYFPYLEGTVDENIIDAYTNKTANMRSMTGSTVEDADVLENIFRAAAAKTTPPNRLS